MALGQHVFLYCERGTDPALFAEPINALSNGGFLLAALVGLQLILWRPREERSADHYLLVALVFLIGLGSLAFHLFATRETALADVIPIALFMLIYLGFALNRLVGVPPGWTVLLVIAFTGLIAFTGQVKCGEGLIALPGATLPGAKTCLNGSLFYIPALAALVVIGLLLKDRGHRAAPYVLWAAAVFAVSVTLRTLDMALCNDTVFDGRKIGTHFLWHLLNALTLFLLLRASLEAGPVVARTVPVVEPVPAKPEEVVPAGEARAEAEVAAELEREKAVAEAEAAKVVPPEPDREALVEAEPDAPAKTESEPLLEDESVAEDERAAEDEPKPKTFFPM